MRSLIIIALVSLAITACSKEDPKQTEAAEKTCAAVTEENWGSNNWPNQAKRTCEQRIQLEGIPNLQPCTYGG